LQQRKKVTTRLTGPALSADWMAGKTPPLQVIS
jgi:hypothetical protein